MWPNGLSALGAIDPELLKRVGPPRLPAAAKRSRPMTTIVFDSTRLLQVKAKGSVIRRQTFTTPNASSTDDLGGLEEQFGQPLLSVFWKRLHSQLAEAVGPELIQLGVNCQVE
jgi:hypothetical protein